MKIVKFTDMTIVKTEGGKKCLYKKLQLYLFSSTETFGPRKRLNAVGFFIKNLTSMQIFL